MPYNNPFRKQKQYLSSSERTKKLSTKTMTSVKNTKLVKASDFTKSKTFFDKNMSYSDRLKYTQGYFQLTCCCDDDKCIVQKASQGKFSYVDLDKIVKSKIYDKHCKFKDYYYIINDCRHNKGIITPRGKLNPVPKQKVFEFPRPIEKLYVCCELKEDPCMPCDKHCSAKHTHYFPTNSQIIKYTHNHNTHPHPKPYPFPNKSSTNFMSKYDLDKSLIGK